MTGDPCPVNPWRKQGICPAGSASPIPELVPWNFTLAAPPAPMVPKKRFFVCSWWGPARTSGLWYLGGGAKGVVCFSGRVFEGGSFLLAGASGELAIHVHRETLVQNHGGIPGAGLHFPVRPRGNRGELAPESVVEFRNHTVVERYFLEPRTGFLQAGRQTVAKTHQSAEILSSNRSIII